MVKRVKRVKRVKHKQVKRAKGAGPGKRGSSSGVKRPSTSKGRSKTKAQAAPGQRRPKTALKARRKSAKPVKSARPAVKVVAKPGVAAAPGGSTPPSVGAPPKVPRLDRDRKVLVDRDEIEAGVPTPPSSLQMNRRGSAARTGRAELAGSLQRHGPVSPAITAGDVDADWGNAYFSGDEAPGGDNPTPDQEVVEDIGTALGVRYNDDEELRASDKVSDRDKHRWELDPASSEDYKDRK